MREFEAIPGYQQTLVRATFKLGSVVVGVKFYAHTH